MTENDFDLATFIPYLLNRAAEKTGYKFERIYKSRYGMLRMEWRVLFHLGHYGPLTAKDICLRGDLHKTKVSRAVAALSDKRYLLREEQAHDRRYEILSLSEKGIEVYQALCLEAASFNRQLFDALPRGQGDHMIAMLQKLIHPN